MSIRLSVATASIALSLALANGATQNKSNSESGVTYTQPSHHRVHFGGLVVGVGYTHFGGYPYPYYGYYPYAYGPWGGPWGWGWYDPFWSSYMYPGFYSGYPYSPSAGRVKLPTNDKAASVFIDGAFAGTADKLKNFWLEPGAYNIELKQGDRVQASQRVYVLTGKTIALQAGVK